MATKKGAKAPTKAPAKRAPRKVVPKDDGIYWVVLERKMLSSNVVGLHRTREDAGADAAERDFESGMSFNKYVVQRVELTL